MKKIDEVIKQTEARLGEIKAAVAAELEELKAKKEEAQQQIDSAYAAMKEAATEGDTKLFTAKRKERDDSEAIIEMVNMRIADLTDGALISDEEYNRMAVSLWEAMDSENKKFKEELAAFVDKAEASRMLLLNNCAAANALYRSLHETNHGQSQLYEFTEQYMPCEIIAYMSNHGGIKKIREECKNEDK